MGGYAHVDRHMCERHVHAHCGSDACGLRGIAERHAHTFKDLGLGWTHTIVDLRPVNHDEGGIIHRF